MLSQVVILLGQYCANSTARCIRLETEGVVIARVVEGLHPYTDCLSVLGMMFHTRLTKPLDLVGSSLSGSIAALLGG